MVNISTFSTYYTETTLLSKLDCILIKALSCFNEAVLSLNSGHINRDQIAVLV